MQVSLLRFLILAPASLPLGCSGQAPGEGSDTPPNVLLYVVDTLRADSLGCYGHPVVETPVTDRLAREGTLFENAITPSSWTRPTVASLLTALYPGVHGVQGREDTLSSDVVLLSETLRERGYATACITTNPNTGSFFGFDQGFDTFLELYERESAGFVQTTELTTTADEAGRAAIEWLESVEQPFFLMVLTIDPHTPYAPPDGFDRYGGDYDGPVDGTSEWTKRKRLAPAEQERLRSLYDGEVAFNDHALGELLDYLRGANLYDDTICVLTADHGEEFWEHGRRGHGRALVQELTRVPLIVRYPPAVAPATRVARTVELVDVYPTILELAGLAPPDRLDGRSLLDPAAANRAFASLRHNRRREVALWRPPFKLVWDLDTDATQLFDLSSPGGELEDVLARHPEQGRELLELATQRIARNATRFAELHGADGPARIRDEDLPDGVRATLEALGYVDEDED